MFQLNNLDVMLIGLTLISMIMSLSRGLTKEVLSIIAWILSTIFIIYLFPYFTPFVEKFVSGNLTAAIVSIVVLLIVFYIVWFLLTFKMLKKLRKSKLSSLDRWLGLIFGFLRAFLLVVLFDILLITLVPEEAKKPIFVESHYFSTAAEFAEPIKNLIPQEALDALREKALSEEVRNNPQILFQELTMPKTSKISDESKQQEGYDNQETQNLDRLIENTVE